MISQPRFLQALVSSSFAYAVMSFLMTATPISMHIHDNMSLNKPYNEKAWPNEEERDAFFKKRNKYIAPGHKDIGIHSNWVNLANR